MKRFIKYPKRITASTTGRPNYNDYTYDPISFIDDTDINDIDVKFIRDLVKLYRLKRYGGGWNISMSRDGQSVSYTSDDDDLYGIADVYAVIDYIKHWKADTRRYSKKVDPLISAILETGETTEGQYIADEPRYSREKRELKSKYRSSAR